MTYDKFLANVDKIASHLMFEFGCKPGDVIAIFSPNSIEWMEMAAATLRVGAVLAAVNHMLKPGTLFYFSSTHQAFFRHLSSF
jgi:acyl-coenzyme A synthetase/AMP-(fatty) acid ligase